MYIFVALFYCLEVVLWVCFGFFFSYDLMTVFDSVFFCVSESSIAFWFVVTMRDKCIHTHTHTHTYIYIF